MKKVNLHGRVIRKFERRTITAPDINDTWCIDLIDMNTDKLSKSGYIFNCLDIVSRYAQSVAIPQKNKINVKEGFLTMFKLFGAKPKKIWSDKESAVIGLKEWLLSEGIELYHTQNSYMGAKSYSLSLIERFNGSMSEKMWQYKDTLPAMNTIQMIHYTIEHFIPYYNNKIHSTIKMTPNDAYKGAFKNLLIDDQYNRERKLKKQPVKMFEVGERVHLQKKKTLIKAKSDTKYSKEVYTITAIKQTNPITYTLSSFGETGFYKQQLIPAGKMEKTTDVVSDTDIESEDEKPEPVQPPKRRSARLLNRLLNHNN